MRRALEAGAEFVALINNDVEVAPDWMRLLLEAARVRWALHLFLTGDPLAIGVPIAYFTRRAIDSE